ncbi:MAG: HAD family hydrolase [Candidatus Limnocylindrales bacterium]
MRRWVCLDVGETLIDETRVWSVWADVLGVTRLTFMAAFGAGIERGGQYSDVFGILGIDDWREYRPQVAAAYGGFQEVDLYPDARRSLDALRAAGYRLALVANQPAERTAELRALGIETEVMAMSEEMGVAKPDPAFFERALDLMGSPPPADVAYVGDRVDNDVEPSVAAGMRAVWLRRGPWAMLRRDAQTDASLVVDSLDELVERIGGCWS